MLLIPQRCISQFILNLDDFILYIIKIIFNFILKCLKRAVLYGHLSKQLRSLLKKIKRLQKDSYKGHCLQLQAMEQDSCYSKVRH
ncbi:unnamed protein product [Paramecium octaurelia]|uniref:Uncharacterized protein n=1 Tax=Paramecium octaurelia TaxID=43137 RepID=A0A8S1U2P1_PAROT|nr:unnamed protein product [Paramecium octaurelia]